MEVISITKNEYERMKTELKFLRNTNIYLRLLEFEDNIIKDKKYTRKELGF